MNEGFYKKVSIVLLIVSAVSIYAAVMYSKVENNIILPPYSYVDLASSGYDYITVSGTLISTGEEGVGNPINTNEFVCDGARSECTLTQAQISQFSGNYLSTYTESFDIASWDGNFIVFSTKKDMANCTVWNYRIDRIKKELIGVREKSNSYSHDACMGVGLDKFEVRLVDGLDALKQ